MRVEHLGFRVEEQAQLNLVFDVVDPRREIRGERQSIGGGTSTLAHSVVEDSLQVWEVPGGGGQNMLVEGVHYTVNFSTGVVTYLAPHPVGGSEYLAWYTKPCEGITGLVAGDFEVLANPEFSFGGPTDITGDLSFAEIAAGTMPGEYVATATPKLMSDLGILPFSFSPTPRGANGEYVFQVTVTSPPAGAHVEVIRQHAVIHDARRFSSG